MWLPYYTVQYLFVKYSKAKGNNTAVQTPYYKEITSHFLQRNLTCINTLTLACIKFGTQRDVTSHTHSRLHQSQHTASRNFTHTHSRLHQVLTQRATTSHTHSHFHQAQHTAGCSFTHTHSCLHLVRDTASRDFTHSLTLASSSVHSEPWLYTPTVFFIKLDKQRAMTSHSHSRLHRATAWVPHAHFSSMCNNIIPWQW